MTRPTPKAEQQPSQQDGPPQAERVSSNREETGVDVAGTGEGETKVDKDRKIQQSVKPVPQDVTPPLAKVDSKERGEEEGFEGKSTRVADEGSTQEKSARVQTESETTKSSLSSNTSSTQLPDNDNSLTSSERTTLGNKEVEFWIRGQEREAGRLYHIVPPFFEEVESSCGCWERNKTWAVEALCFIGILFIGFSLLDFGFETESDVLTPTLTPRKFVAASFFDASVVSCYTFVMQIVSYICCEQNHNDSTLNKRKLAKYLLQVVPFIAYFAVGASNFLNMVKHKQSWGKAFVESCMVECSRRLIFFVPRPENEVRRLEKELDTAKASIAIGLADGYFSNFLEPILMDIKEYKDKRQLLPISYVDEAEESCDEDEKDGMQSSTGSTQRQKPAQIDMEYSTFFVAVPRKISWDELKPICNFIDGIYMKNVKTVADCHIEKDLNRSMLAIQGRNRRKQESRPHWILLDKAASPKSTLFDVPTTLGVLARMIRENKELESPERKDEEYQKEINRFTWRLQWQLSKAGLEGMVRTVELENDIEATTDSEVGENKAGGDITTGDAGTVPARCGVMSVVRKAIADTHQLRFRFRSKGPECTETNSTSQNPPPTSLAA